MPPAPQSNVEKYLNAIAGHGGEIPSEPLSRVEYYLDEIVKGGGIGGKLRPEIVSALPATGETGLLYLVPSQGSGRNLYNEYFWIEDESRFELLGQTTVEVDLSGYVPNSRKVGGKSLSNDIGITISGTGAIEVADNGTASSVAVDISHKDSGVTAGSKGDTTNQTPGFGGTFKVLSATVDAKGHVTSLGDHTVEVPSDTATTSKDGLMSKTDKAKLDAIGVTASAPLEVTKTGETYNVTLKDSGVTAGSKGDTANQTPGFGDTFKALSATVDAKGRITSLAEHSVQVPDTEATQSAKGLMSAADKTKLDTLIDATLSNTGQAADAKTTGDNLAALRGENALLRELINGIDAPIYRTASGNPATFADGYPANVRSLAVTLTPTQSGSGDPSPTNIRPISGVSSVSVTRTGKNLWGGNKMLDDFASVPGASISGTKVTYTAGTAAGSVFSKTIKFKENTSYTFILSYTTTTRTVLINVLVRFTDGTQVRLTKQNNDVNMNTGVTVYTSPANKTVAYLGNDYHEGNTTLDSALCGIFEGVVTADDFELYQGQTIALHIVDSNSDPLTVYGGTLNVTTGELTVTWDEIQSYNGETLPGVWISDRDVYSVGATPTTGAQVVYELASPVTYQLTPAQLATLSGYNSVTTDAETLSVTYRADTALTLGGG